MRWMRVEYVVAICLSLCTAIIVPLSYAAGLDVADVNECETRLRTAQEANSAFAEKKKTKKQECDKHLSDVNRALIETESAKNGYDTALRNVKAAEAEHWRVFQLYEQAQKRCIDEKVDCDKVWPLYEQMAQAQQAQTRVQEQFDEANKDWLAAGRKYGHYHNLHNTCSREMERLNDSAPPFSRLEIKTIQKHCEWLRSAQGTEPRQPAGAPGTQQARPPQASTPGDVRLGPVGPVEDRVDAPVTLMATVTGGGQATARTKHGYYWYVNYVFRTSGINMNSYSFKVPRVGLRQVKVAVKVVRTDDEGKSWQPVGEAAYDFSRTVTGRTLKIGYQNYQKLPGFAVTVNGTTQSCPTVCSFEVPPGPCSISVQASGYKTESFQHTCDKDETMITTLSKTH